MTVDYYERGYYSMGEYISIFKGKSNEELKKIYGQLLQVEKTTIMPNELNEIRNMYCEFCNSNPLWSDYNPFIVLKLDLLHTIADLWYEQMNV